MFPFQVGQMICNGQSSLPYVPRSITEVIATVAETPIYRQAFLSTDSGQRYCLHV